MPNIGFQELLIILLICVILFGGSKLASIGKGLGEGIKNFKSAINGSKEKDDSNNKPGN